MSNLVKNLGFQTENVLKNGTHLLAIEEILQRLGSHSLQRRWLRVDLVTAFKIFTSFLGVDSNLSFLPPTQRGLIVHPYKVLLGA